ncbi:uncharacterized protein N0V89_003521 [Didymosphaeria variabile]|uniref:Nucleoporin Nup82 n=1 Tax=Didymosphaeria variabile TaxID=1932322 RepID=A0A9W8XQP4_9PLEO|nr:uncharacterized protein N0V89_003521 [Didymosphaeria variabile]KAJ4355505.1 hypothetical protein N0V89_003521 [Didymosphaeria variabile]
MPKVLSHTPRWLQRPSRGHELFAPKASNGRALAQKERAPGLRKTIAARNSEVFVAVGNEIRWADLENLKEGEDPMYRTLKISIPLPIERLDISPNGEYLAVSTSHTVHIVVLPEASLLLNGDDSPIKPKTFQVGPTAHVLEESPIASILWHPLGYQGRCLVTITQSGVVRLWEINRADRSSFCETSLSIDLQKLANAKNDQENLSASQYGATKGFSPDAADLEVASACFGDSPDQEGVHGWAPMTLWIATVSGDVYALCPLLPSKWQLVNSAGAETFKQTLITTININHADITENNTAPREDMALADKQIKWLSDIIYQEPFTEQLSNDDTITVFNRPTSVPAVPLLQGPFSVVPEVEDFELSDMIVYSLKTFSEGGEEEIAEGLPSAVVCLLTDTCEVHICLDLEGIVGRWLPSAEDGYVPEPPEHVLAVVETVALANDGVSSSYQSITPDVRTDFSFFVSHVSGVFYVSLEPWIRKLENELYEPQTEGADFRLQRLLESANTVAERCIRRNARDTTKDVTACVVIEETSVGYMVLTTFDNEPQAVLLDAPVEGAPTDEELKDYMQWETPASDNREPWQPPKEFWDNFSLHASLQGVRRSKASWDEEIKLSPANLEVLMTAHRVLAEHTETLQLRVSDLFNRCQRLQDEYRDQITRAAQVMEKVDTVTGRDDEQSGPGLYGNRKIEDRLEKVQAKQEAQKQRYLALRRKMASINTTQLSDKEVQFVEELRTMEGSLDKTEQRLTDNADGSEVPVWERVDKVKDMQQTLSEEVEGGVKASGEQRSTSSMKVPSHSRKQEHEQIQAMLQHQTDLLQATADRLRSNGVSIPLVAEDGAS